MILMPFYDKNLHRERGWRRRMLLGRGASIRDKAIHTFFVISTRFISTLRPKIVHILSTS